ncbi:MAG: PRC-barrel domain-containing protein [Nanoarchaeota archaeon]|jgi:sporulation protein YlmC with PRC-barrel domain|nr:PRC-barrel domain-containing protein [Nanoarchaeota archaeon]
MRVKKITEVLGKRVYTDSGDFFGEIEEANLYENKVDSWRIKVASHLNSVLGGARGVVIPHQFVKAVSDIFIINKAALPSQEMDMDESADII